MFSGPGELLSDEMPGERRFTGMHVDAASELLPAAFLFIALNSRYYDVAHCNSNITHFLKEIKCGGV